ncbi:MAG: recombination regulator RecX [Pseudomonadota bacterium]|nr:recombination regulator RecX [Pseudomonadota bacterium]
MTDEFFPDRSARRRKRVELTTTQRAVGLLSRREHSRRELTRKLVSRGLDPSEVEVAVGKLAADGWQDDGRFAESLVRARVSGGYGPLRIRAELATHGLDAEAVGAALATFGGDWAENACDLVRRRFGEDFHADTARRRKAADLLVRRGFSGDSVRQATRPGRE